MASNTHYINEQAVSKITSRALSTLRNDRHKKQGIRYIKVGSSVRYSLKDVIDFMDAHRIETNER